MIVPTTQAHLWTKRTASLRNSFRKFWRKRLPGRGSSRGDRMERSSESAKPAAKKRYRGRKPITRTSAWMRWLCCGNRPRAKSPKHRRTLHPKQANMPPLQPLRPDILIKSMPIGLVVRRAAHAATGCGSRGVRLGEAGRPITETHGTASVENGAAVVKANSSSIISRLANTSSASASRRGNGRTCHSLSADR